MAEQYFAADPSVGHDEQIIQYRIGETSLRLTTDRGVFSRQPLTLFPHLDTPVSYPNNDLK